MPCQPGDVQVIRISPSVDLGPGLEQRRITEVTFMVRGHGPFRVTGPTAEFDQAPILMAMKALTEEICTVLETGQEVTRVTGAVVTSAMGPLTNALNVEFRVRGAGPYSIALPSGQFTASEALRLMQARRVAIEALLDFTG